MPISWDDLYALAESQAGYFTTAQAGELGWLPQNLRYHVQRGNLRRVRRGIYRLTRFPPSDQEDLVVVWLWSGRQAVFSHETALAMHSLSDLLPSRIHVTVPGDWTARRLRWPANVEPHYSDLEDHEITWVGDVPVTEPARTLNDCAEAEVQRDKLAQARREGLARGLFVAAAIWLAAKYLDGDS